MQRASLEQEKYIANLAGELAETAYADDAQAFLASAGINLDTNPRLIGVRAAQLGRDAAQELISRLLRLRAVATSSRAVGA